MDNQRDAWAVRDLIAYLQTLNQDALVVMSKDAEGNGYAPLRTVDEDRYVADTSYSGFILHGDSDTANESVACVVLWPVN